MVKQFINSMSNSAVIDLELDNSEEKSKKKFQLLQNKLFLTAWIG